MNNIYDLIILGTGPAGLTAGIYAARYKLKTLAIGMLDGGIMTESHKICNFPTEIDISGFDLAEKMKQNALNNGVELKNGSIKNFYKKDNQFYIVLDNNEEYVSKTILISTGTEHRKLNLENEKEFLGKGVSYCSTCDGMFYKNKDVIVVGGGDSALVSALYLSDIANKVYLIYRGKEFRGEPAWIDNINKKNNIEILTETNIKKIIGNNKIESVELDKKYNESNILNIDGVFIEIGTEPETSKYHDVFSIDIDENKYIKVDQAQKTNIDGIWAAGDITTGSNKFRQIVTACAEGAVAAENIFHYIKSK